MGVDVARHGADQTVIRFRRGLVARSIPAVKVRIPDTMQLAEMYEQLAARVACRGRSAAYEGSSG